MPGSSLSGFSPTGQIRDKKTKIQTQKVLLKASGQVKPVCGQKAPSGGNSRQQIMAHQHSEAARFTSRNLLASSSLLCHNAINLSAPSRTPVYHGTPSLLRAASVQTSLSTPKVRRSVGVEPCRAPNALKSSLKLFCQCCAGSRVFPPLESLGEQQPLRESLVTLSGQGPCEQKPSLANYRFHNLAPGFLGGFSVRHITVGFSPTLYC